MAASGGSTPSTHAASVLLPRIGRRQTENRATAEAAAQSNDRADRDYSQGLLRRTFGHDVLAGRLWSQHIGQIERSRVANHRLETVCHLSFGESFTVPQLDLDVFADHAPRAGQMA